MNMPATGNGSAPKKPPVKLQQDDKKPAGRPSGTAKKTAPAKKPSAQSKASEKEEALSVAGKKQKAAIILMATALFMIFVAFIKGESVWLWLHNALFGLFGFCAYIWPAMLIFLSVFYAKEKSVESITAGLIGVGVFVFLLGGSVHVFANPADYFRDTALGTQLTEAWQLSSPLGGGFIGAFIGGIFALLFGKVGAAITLIILLVLVLMLLTGTTVLKAFGMISTPVKKVGEYTAEKLEHNIQKRAEEDELPAGKKQDSHSRFAPPAAPTEAATDVPKAKTKASKDKIPSSDPAVFNPAVSIPVINIPAPPTPVEPVKPVPVPAPAVPDIHVEDIPVSKPAKKETPPKKTASAKKEPAKAAPVQDESKQEDYQLPSVDLLDILPPGSSAGIEQEIENNSRTLISTLDSFNVRAEITGVCVGPSVTRYELVPQAGIKISKITSLSDDIALRLAATGVRIEAPIPGKAAIGIEVPNHNKSTVGLREIIESPTYKSSKSRLNVALGKDITGNIICADIAKMPHLLVAGTTGSGKSVCMNAMIISILFNATPDEVKILLIDPKQVEFTVYNGIPHLEVPVVTDARKAAGALGWAVTEMQRRYKLFSENNVRDIGSYNKLAAKKEELKPLHQTVIFIDELSDLMMAAPSDVEDSICRLAQMARAAGMHLVIATQRPSADVITGLIKANIPSRIALSVSSATDSRIILDTMGAEKLLGNGDMLFNPQGKTKPTRVQGCYVSDDEREKIIDFIKAQNENQCSYNEDTIHEIESIAAQTAMAKKKGASSAALDEAGGDRDEMIDKAIEVVVEMGQASTTMLQKKLKLGYARASRIIDELEEMGIIGPSEGAKPRSVLITKQQYYERSALSSAASDDSISTEPVQVEDFIGFDDAKQESFFEDDEPGEVDFPPFDEDTEDEDDEPDFTPFDEDEEDETEDEDVSEDGVSEDDIPVSSAEFTSAGYYYPYGNPEPEEAEEEEYYSVPEPQYNDVPPEGVDVFFDDVPSEEYHDEYEDNYDDVNDEEDDAADDDEDDEDDSWLERLGSIDDVFNDD